MKKVLEIKNLVGFIAIAFIFSFSLFSIDVNVDAAPSKSKDEEIDTYDNDDNEDESMNDGESNNNEDESTDDGESDDNEDESMDDGESNNNEDESTDDGESDEVKEVTLPRITFWEPVCLDGRDISAGYTMNNPHDITFDIEGELGAGETIVFTATPDENIKLIENQGWTIKDNIGTIEHTFKELDCEDDNKSEDKDESKDNDNKSDDEEDGSKDDSKSDNTKDESKDDGKSDDNQDNNESDEQESTENNENKQQEEEEAVTVVESNDGVDNEKGGKLPDTATSTFNWMLVGGASLAAGGLGILLTRKKKATAQK